MFRDFTAMTALAFLLSMQGSLLMCRVECAARGAGVAAAKTGQTVHSVEGGAERHISGAQPSGPSSDDECRTQSGSFDLPNSSKAVAQVAVNRIGWFSANPAMVNASLHLGGPGEWLGAASPPARSFASPPAVTIRI